MPRETRQVGSSIAFPFYREIESNPKARLALALFREGLTVNSIPFSFLSFFKILNIFWNDKKKNGKNELIEGLRATLPKIRDELAKKRLLALAVSNDAAQYLYESCRCAVAHAHTGTVIDPDDVNDLKRLAEDRWLIKAVAEHLIATELGISRSITK